jgi:Ser/Thr protein kinase RdoA (MazF antagonist)
LELHDLSGGQAVLKRLQEVAEGAVAHYDFSPNATVRILNVSENATYQVDDPATGRKAVIRVHRLGYHSHAAVMSELQWMTSLREAGAINAPAVIPTTDGQWIVSTHEPRSDEPRKSVMFEFVSGTRPNEDHLVESFDALGEMTARMHAHTRAWPLPKGFTRHHWDYEAAFGPAPRWGRWQDAPGLGADEHSVLERAVDTLRRRLAAYGKGDDRYGLVHTDLRLDNLIVDGDTTTVIDFDDSGFSWFLYDLGGALGFLENHPQVDAMIESWVHGYRRVLNLSDIDVDEIPTFVLYRRMTLLAWSGSHPNTDLAPVFGDEFVTETCVIADRYVHTHG